ncbi:RING finger protein 215 isoform X2 [Corythoichthys intestinalis]|uniref:RING finger protein 215 isoform X2 n=1 Tax=Corythoichthys intestinalis TaxID=161448 RepID=UPI0025A65C15|nr:RING finger protein 215 isoform X2 [Corythoichthys intestinalis]XP_061811436.1 RING finger protein 215 [Nerophis lumbriciformis]
MASSRVALLWPVLLPFTATAALLVPQQVAVVEAYAEKWLSGALLRGKVVTTSRGESADGRGEEPESMEGDLVLIQDVEPRVSRDDMEKGELWIGVMPVEDHQGAFGKKQKSFTESVVSKMKRALVLGASALIILALNQNTVREMDLSQVLSKPVIIIQTSENVTRLIGALLKGLHASAKITFSKVLHDNLGATLTLWSSCGRSRGGRYGEWQGVICTGETKSQVQKNLQQLWDTILWVVFILSTGVILQARRLNRERQLHDNMESFPKQDVLKTMSSLQTKMYQMPKVRHDETDNCAVCLEPFHQNQRLRVLPCRHEYHQECVDPWLLLRHTCPLCKRSILGGICRSS